jgi:hypothetical protein
MRQNGFTSRGLSLTREERSVETRLRILRTRHMSRRRSAEWVGFLLGICLNVVAVSAATAEHLHWSKTLSGEETRCLSELMRASNWQDDPAAVLQKLSAEAMVSRVHLNRDGRKQYVYVIHDFGWCGSAGCALLIGENREDGICHLLYYGHGDDDITVLSRRDNGYRHLYTQCKIRFDGSRYQQIHPDCPTLNTQH